MKTSYDMANLDAHEPDDVLELTPDLRMEEAALDSGYIREWTRALKVWEDLRNERAAPLVSDTGGKFDAFGNGQIVMLDFSRSRQRPAIEPASQNVPPVFQALRDEEGRLNPFSIRPGFIESCLQALEAQAPTDGQLVRSGEGGRSYPVLLLPFSVDGAAASQVMCLLPEQEHDDHADELLLYQELDPDEEPALSGQKEEHHDRPFFHVIAGEKPPVVRPARAASASSRLPVPAMAAPSISSVAVSPPGFPTGSNATLHDYLAIARELAQAAGELESRSRGALYRALGGAYDFALAVVQEPAGFTELAHDAGLTMQARAPMMPLLKLVFGLSYNKTRLSEYATILDHALRVGICKGHLEEYLLESQGGLKSIVNAERQLRKSDRPAAIARRAPQPQIARALRSMPALRLSDLADQADSNDEFVLIVARRDGGRRLNLIGEVPQDIALLERAARKMLKGAGQ
ncbi:hypothetical protein RXV95_07645 [Novosphingobium sp. ZN18A2]|uniref:hypothetical protein n=1 Tax=Novosphingobium sp. ZN18A2 TaxID=3079861 RepID=UPI0030CEC0DA